ncbi:exosortase family protein XrtF [Leeuwenhoekiella sp. W20_SRS_FM14]|uniref:exosortase family protein XrtF n=1 Tax=Leeuwenhoekiella sp. W20_SRS_FM14 TaxID=3240270 RepID=UPI003F99B0D0
MLDLIRKYKSVLLFILTFLGVYVVLSVGYAIYLKQEFSIAHYPDYVTHQVAVQSNWIINKTEYSSFIEPHSEEASMKLFVEDYFVVRVVEGCNGVNVIILFTAFVFSFYQGFKKTMVFFILGSLLIYGINVLRIVIISIGLYKIPEYSKILHDILFPAIIYGTVVLLWLFWIKRFKKISS